MLQEQNKRTVRRFVEEYQNGADEDAFAEILAPDVIDHSRPPGIAEGAEGVRQQFDGFRAAFPDFAATILDQIAEGDLVVTRKVFRGTHQGELMGVPPTGRAVTIDVIDIVRLEHGRIVEHWNVVDRLGLMQQLGVLPEPSAA
jgi:predicted ester cyclase